LPLSADLSQAVCPSLPLASNRTYLRFTCNSLTQHHSVSKISLLRCLPICPRQLVHPYLWLAKGHV
jgi:hypothetical protein